MEITWGNIRSLLIFFGPILLPKAISWYRSRRNLARRHHAPIQPVPQHIQIALAILFAIAFSHLIKTLPYFAPENLFVKTESRLQIPVDVLFNRLTAIRPDNALTDIDVALRAKFVNMESRLLYLTYGPRVLADCPFCNSNEPQTYFYYAVTDILWPHITNFIALAVVTSPSWTGKHGGRWRVSAAISAILIAALELYIVGSYNYKANARALRLNDITMFYWSTRNYRHLVLAILDGLLGFVLFLSSTNRAFTQAPTPAERVEKATRAINVAKSKMSALGIIRNTALRDEDLRSRNQAYWNHEVRFMNEAMEDKEVIDGVRDALASRIDIQEITRDASSYAETVLEPLHSTMENDS